MRNTLHALAEIDEQLTELLRRRDDRADELICCLHDIDAYEGRIDVLLQRRVELMDDHR